MKQEKRKMTNNKKIRVFLLAFLFSFFFFHLSSLHAQTSRFEKTFRYGSGDAKVTGATIYIINETSGDSLLLTEYSGNKAGTYYRDSTPYGQYRIRVNGTLVTEHYYFGTERQRSLIESIDSDGNNLIDQGGVVYTGGIHDSTIAMVNLSQTVIDYIDASGGGTITNNADGVTIGVNGSSQLYILDNSITSARIVDGTITSSDILDGTIAAGDIANNTITDGQLADNCIDDSKIQDGSIVDDDIGSAQVTWVKLSADVQDSIRTGAVSVMDSVKVDDVTIEKTTHPDTLSVKAQGIGVSHINSTIVWTGQGLSWSTPNGMYISNNGVTTARIKDYAVTAAKLDSNLHIVRRTCNASAILIDDGFGGTMTRTTITEADVDTLYFDVPFEGYALGDTVEIDTIRVNWKAGVGEVIGYLRLYKNEFGTESSLWAEETDAVGDGNNMTTEYVVNTAVDPSVPLILHMDVGSAGAWYLYSIEFQYHDKR